MDQAAEQTDNVAAPQSPERAAEQAAEWASERAAVPQFPERAAERASDQAAGLGSETAPEQPAAQSPHRVARPRRYLFALTDGGGTVPPELGVARRLAARGHDVTVLGEASMAQQARAAGVAFRLWAGGDAAQLRDWERQSPVRMMREMADHMVVGPAPAQAQDVVEAIGDVRPELVLASFTAFGAMVAAEAHNVPFDVLMPNTYSLPARGMPLFGTSMRPARGPLGRWRDAVLGRAAVKALDICTLERLNELRGLHGLPVLAGTADQVHAARRELVLSSAGFDFPADVPANVRYVGPVLDDPAWAAGAWAPPVGEGPLVLVALSSTFQNQSGCLQRIIDALGALPVRGLVTTGPAVDPGALRPPVNVTVCRTAPHSAAMRAADLVITHGGHGTVVKALCAGAPLLILHHGRDQGSNAVRVTARGAGVAVRRTSSPGRIARAVAAVLEDPGYRAAAHRLGAQLEADARGPALLDALEW